MRFKPIGNNVVVERLALPEQKVSQGGLHIPDMAQPKSPKAKVVACGPGGRLPNGTLVPLDVKVGDVILLARWAGAEIEIDGKQYLIVPEHEILAVED